MDAQEQNEDRKSRSGRSAKAVGAFLLLLASRLWAGLVGGWREMGRRDAADIAAARERNADDASAAHSEGEGKERRRRSIFLWLPKRRSAVVALLLLLLLLLLWRCSHDGTPTGHGSVAAGGAGNESGASTPVCDGLLEHAAWTGRITYKHARDVADPDGRYHVQYAYDLDLGAELVERTRRQHRGRDYLVQVFSPNPDGRTTAQQHLQDFDNLGLASAYRFSATGGVNKFEEGMSETGSMMSLTVKDDCSYRVFLQAQVLGKGTRYDRHKGTTGYEGMLGIPAVRAEGIAGDGSRISGTSDIPLLSERFLEQNRNNPDWDSYHYVIERDQVAKALGEDKLGTVTVSWHFEAVD